jgi:hypothetical protein
MDIFLGLIPGVSALVPVFGHNHGFLSARCPTYPYSFCVFRVLASIVPDTSVGFLC